MGSDSNIACGVSVPRFMSVACRLEGRTLDGEVFQGLQGLGGVELAERAEAKAAKLIESRGRRMPNLHQTNRSNAIIVRISAIVACKNLRDCIYSSGH
jgi:hypothetical protein